MRQCDIGQKRKFLVLYRAVFRVRFVTALISASYWEKDWRWAEQQLANFSAHQDELVLWAVATGFGFIAAFNGDLDEGIVDSILTRLKTHSSASVVGAAEGAEADIEHFVHAIIRAGMPDELLAQLGTRIKKLRLRRGWTQIVMAERVGIDRSFLADVERGKRNISILNLDLIAQGLGLSLSKLLSGI